jgi:hypothetical protein
MAKQETLHDRFVKLGREVWTPPENATPMDLSISPDGKQIAFVANEQLHVGPLDGPANPVAEVGAGAAGGGGVGPGGGPPGAMGGPPGAMGGWPRRSPSSAVLPGPLTVVSSTLQTRKVA